MMFYKKSHLLRYTEEVLAEGYAKMSVRKGLAYPFAHNYHYKISGFRLAVEGAAYGGMLYGSYRLGSFLGGDSDRP